MFNFDLYVLNKDCFPIVQDLRLRLDVWTRIVLRSGFIYNSLCEVSNCVTSSHICNESSKSTHKSSKSGTSGGEHFSTLSKRAFWIAVNSRFQIQLLRAWIRIPFLYRFCWQYPEAYSSRYDIMPLRILNGTAWGFNQAKCWK